MDYAAFKSYMATFLWRSNDLDLVANLDSLIVMANHELNRVLDLQRRTVLTPFAVTSNSMPLPADFRSIKFVAPTGVYQSKPLTMSTLSNVVALRNFPNATLKALPVYALSKSGGVTTLELPLPAGVLSDLLTLNYRTAVPDFAATNESWVCDDFLDLYVYTTLSHAAPFLREDDRIQIWDGMKNAALVSALDEDKSMIEFGGSPLEMKPHHFVP